MASCFRLVSSNTSRTPSVLWKVRALGSRNAHTGRPLPYSIEGGLGKFLPPPALETMVEYQDGLLERLNHELRTDPQVELHQSVANIALKYSQLKERTLAFNYAVLAINNSFFLDNLTPPPPEDSGLTNHQHNTSVSFMEAIRNNHGDFPQLKSTFSSAALGMFTNGWVWLVTDTKGRLGVLPTFGPSTLLIRSRMNMGRQTSIFREESRIPEPPPPSSFGAGMSALGSVQNKLSLGANPTSPVSGASFQRPATDSTPLDPHARSYTNSASELTEMLHKSRVVPDKSLSSMPVAELLTVGDTLYPLLCLPTYEHAWMSAGFGVWGKEEWIKEFWSVVDWQKVSSLYASALDRSTGHLH